MLIILLVGQTIIGTIGSAGAIEDHSTENTTEQAELEGEETEVNKDALASILEKAEEYLNKEDEYTEDSFATFVDEMTAGENIFADEYATQDEVDNAVTAIEK